MSAKSDKNCFLFKKKKNPQNYDGPCVSNLILSYQALYITKEGYLWIPSKNFSP